MLRYSHRLSYYVMEHKIAIVTKWIFVFFFLQFLRFLKRSNRYFQLLTNCVLKNHCICWINFLWRGNYSLPRHRQSIFMQIAMEGKQIISMTSSNSAAVESRVVNFVLLSSIICSLFSSINMNYFQRIHPIDLLNGSKWLFLYNFA